MCTKIFKNENKTTKKMLIDKTVERGKKLKLKQESEIKWMISVENKMKHKPCLK